MIQDANLTLFDRGRWMVKILWKKSRSAFRGTPVLFVIGLLAAAALPLSSGPALWDSGEDAADFLGLMWQVTAGTLGVAVAALIFLYESFGSVARRRRVLSLAEFAARTGVLKLVGLLSGSLILTGAVILGWGDEAPMGWSAFLAIAVALRALIALPGAFAAAAQAISPDQVQQMFHESIEPKVAAVVRRDLQTICMRQLLDERLALLGITSPTYGGSAWASVLRAPESGFVDDVNLGRMTAQLSALAGAEVRIPLHSRVQAGDPIASLPASPGPQDARFLRVVNRPRLGAKWDDFTLMKNLQLDARESVRDRDNTALESCMQLHEEVVRALLDYEKTVLQCGLPSLSGHTDLLSEIRTNLLKIHYFSVDEKDIDAARTIAAAAMSLMHLAREQGDFKLAGMLLGTLGAMGIYEMRHS